MNRLPQQKRCLYFDNSVAANGRLSIEIIPLFCPCAALFFKPLSVFSLRRQKATVLGNGRIIL
ncbi:MAG: hypothetical protein GY805_10010 [Chloroflexi bacterium]|nr:hypothetical protein [Chloroflexota bacterium]